MAPLKGTQERYGIYFLYHMTCFPPGRSLAKRERVYGAERRFDPPITILTANRRPVSFLFLTLGHTFGVRIHRVLRVPRVVVAASPLDTPANGQPTIGRPFYGQAKDQLRLTCAFYAECAHEG